MVMVSLVVEYNIIHYTPPPLLRIIHANTKQSADTYASIRFRFQDDTSLKK